MNERSVVFAAAINMFVAVAAGAFGAHALKNILGSDMLAVWHTAVTYQMVHALGLFAIALLMPRSQPALLARAAVLMLAGIVAFCGSLYALAIGGAPMLGAITPIGGAGFLIAWVMVAWAAWRG